MDHIGLTHTRGIAVRAGGELPRVDASNRRLRACGFTHHVVAAGDVGVEASPADVLAHLVEDHDIERLERQLRQQCVRLGEQLRLRCEQLRRGHSDDRRGHIVLILDDGDAPDDTHSIQDDLGDRRQHLPEAPVVGVLVCQLRTTLFAHANDEHLGEAALDVSGEAGVWLDTVDHADPIRAGRRLIHDDRDIVRPSPAHLGRLHRCDDGTPHRGLGDPVAREHGGLPFGSGTAVAAHRREDERLIPRALEGRDHRCDDPREVGDAA
jgi:hypothetical protein